MLGLGGTRRDSERLGETRRGKRPARSPPGARRPVWAWNGVRRRHTPCVACRGDVTAVSLHTRCARAPGCAGIRVIMALQHRRYRCTDTAHAGLAPCACAPHGETGRAGPGQPGRFARPALGNTGRAASGMTDRARYAPMRPDARSDDLVSRNAMGHMMNGARLSYSTPRRCAGASSASAGRL